MALLGAAIAPVIHCSNWQIVPLFSGKMKGRLGSDGETFSCPSRLS
jgi:hypothetical protein